MNLSINFIPSIYGINLIGNAQLLCAFIVCYYSHAQLFLYQLCMRTNLVTSKEIHKNLQEL